MGKSSFSGYDPGLPSGKSSPASNVDFSDKGKEGGKQSPLVGVGSDSQPRYDDNRPGANRWPMGENKQIDGDKKRFANQKNIGKGPSGL